MFCFSFIYTVTSLSCMAGLIPSCFLCFEPFHTKKLIFKFINFTVSVKRNKNTGLIRLLCSRFASNRWSPSNRQLCMCVNQAGGFLPAICCHVPANKNSAKHRITLQYNQGSIFYISNCVEKTPIYN